MSDLYGLAFRQVLYPGWEAGCRRRPTLSYLARLKRSQWSSLDALNSLQVQELRRLLEHAHRHCSYYQRRFQERALEPNTIRSLDDLAKYPLLTRQEAAQHAEARMSSVEPLPRIRKMTSGTTGRPVDFAYDVGSEYWRQAVKLRGYGWAGYELGDRSLHYWGDIDAVKAPSFARKLKTRIYRFVRREHYIDCADHSQDALARVVREIRRLKPRVIVCYAQAGAAIARYVAETNSRDWNDICVISAAERLFPAHRSLMAEAFGPNVFETYGSREVMLIAAECGVHEGLHISMENLVVEVVVRAGDTERPAQPGELGEVVVTDLHNYGAPFIRYLTGDLAVALPPGRCACGRALGRLDRVEGRQTDTLRDIEGRPIGGMFFAVLFSVLADKVREFQVVQRKDRSIDIKVVPTSQFDDSLLETIQRNCEKTIRGVHLRTHVVADIPVGPGGKSRVVMVET